MGKRKDKIRNDVNRSVNERDNYVPIYDGLLKHPNFLKLSNAERMFYICCCMQLKSAKALACLHKHANAYERTYPSTCFVFPTSHMQEYGYLPTHGRTYIKKLTEKGFIRVYENNHNQRLVNVYQFTDGWKHNKLD